MSNWSKSGTIYIRQGGNDITGDGSAASPYATLEKISTNNITLLPQNSVIVIGDSLNIDQDVPLNGNYCSIYGDGIVTIENGLGPALYLSGRNWKIYNLKIQNSSVGIYCPVNRGLTQCKNVQIVNCTESWSIRDELSDIKIENLTVKGIGKVFATQSSIRIQRFANFNNMTILNDNLRFFNRYVTSDYSVINNSHFQDCQIQIDTLGLPTPFFRNCNFWGDTNFLIDGIAYADFAAASAALPARFVNCISQDPIFSDEENLDFSLQSTSPLLTSSSDGTFIGAVGLGFKFDYNGIESHSGVDITGPITLTGSPTGTVTFNPIDFGADYVLDKTTLLRTEDYFNSLTVDSNQTLLEPNQRTVELRFATQEEITELGLAAALSSKPWKIFVRNGELVLDASGNPTYDINFDILSSQPIIAGGAQARITLRDNAIRS